MIYIDNTGHSLPDLTAAAKEGCLVAMDTGSGNSLQKEGADQGNIRRIRAQLETSYFSRTPIDALSENPAGKIAEKCLYLGIEAHQGAVQEAPRRSFGVDAWPSAEAIKAQGFKVVVLNEAPFGKDLPDPITGFGEVDGYLRCLRIAGIDVTGVGLDPREAQWVKQQKFDVLSIPESKSEPKAGSAR